MAFGRILQVKVGSDPLSNSAVMISDLNMEVEVERSIYYDKGGTCELTVFNATSKMREECCRQGAGIEVRIGYDDELGGSTGAIFIGNVLEGYSTLTSGTWVTRVRASASRPVGKVLETTVVSVSYRAGSQLREVLRDVAVALGLKLDTAKMPAIALPNGFTEATTSSVIVRRLRDILVANGYGLYMDNNEMLVYQAGVVGDYQVTTLTADSGLLKISKVESAASRRRAIMSRKSKKKPDTSNVLGLVEFSSLALPEIQPNAVIGLRASAFTGRCLVETVKFKLDNSGGSWTAECTGLYP